jgi:hypothetical protein
MSDGKSNGAGPTSADEEELVLVVKRPFEIETASGRRFIVHAASEAAARLAFKAAIADGAVAFHKSVEGALKPIGEFGQVVSVRLEPPVKTTLQEGPMTRDRK